MRPKEMILRSWKFKTFGIGLVLFALFFVLMAFPKTVLAVDDSSAPTVVLAPTPSADISPAPSPTTSDTTISDPTDPDPLADPNLVPTTEMSPAATDPDAVTNTSNDTTAPVTTDSNSDSSAPSDPVITSTETGGAWSDNSTWIGGMAPAPGDSVIIATVGEGAVILDANVSIANLTINSGILSAGGKTLTLSGDWRNSDGTFIAGEGTVNFDDSSKTSNIYGNNTFNNLICLAPGKTIIFEADTLNTIQNTLILEGGFDNYITLKSSIADVNHMFGIYINSVSDAAGDPYLKNLNVYYSHAYGPVTPITVQNEYIPAELNIGWDATYTTSQSGDWNVASTWGGAGTPGNADTAVITASWIVTVTANATVSALNFGVAGTGAVNGILKINSGVQLTVTNAITVYGTANANTTATIQDGTGAGTIICGTVQIGGAVTPSAVVTNKLISNITNFTSSGTTTLQSYRSGSSYNNPMFDLQSGTFSGTTVTMTSANSSTTLTFTMANGAHTGTLKLSSLTPWTVPANGVTTLNTASNTVEYTGASAVAIRVTPYYNLTLSGASGTYTGIVTSVSGTLTMSGGVVWTQDAITTSLAAVSISGTASLTVGANMAISGALTISGGTFNVNAKTLAVTGLTTVNGGTYQPSTAAQTLTGGLTFSSGTITQNTGTISIAGNMTVSGSPTFTKSASGLIVFKAGNTNQTLTSSGIDIGNIQISANSGNTTLTLQDALNADNITIDASQTLDTKNGTNAAISSSGTWANSGTFTAQNGTVTFDGSSAQTITSGGSNFYHVTFSNSTAGTDINYTGAMAIDGNVTLTQNTTIASTNNTAITITGTINGANILSINAGSATVTFGGIIGGGTPITSLASSGAGTVNINTTGITTRDVAANNVSFTGPVTLGANLTITTDNAVNDGSITFSSTINGNNTLTLNAGTGGTITITGALGGGTALGAVTVTNCSSGTFSSTVNAASYINTAGSVSMSDNVVLTGNLTIVAGTLTAPGTGKSICLTGNWSQSGTFIANGGTVIFNGTNQKIFGSTTFYNLTKDVSGSAADILLFQQSNTQAIAANGTLTLKGALGKILTLRGCDGSGNETSGNPKWGLNVSNTGTTFVIDYLDVKDSDATAGKTITQTNSNDSGNNLNWTFDITPPTVSSVAVQTGLTVNIVFSEAMGTGVTTATNYTVSGTGKGTLANNPNTAALVAGNTYVLTWAAGEMFNGGDITITVANAQDLAGNPIGSPNSGTHTGGAIGVAPTVTITDPTAGTKAGTNKIISFTDNETTNPQCSVDNSNWTACTSGVTTLGTIPEFAGLVEGNTFTLYLKDTDAAGNIGTNNVVNITKDTTSPTVSSVAVQTGLTVNIVFSEAMGTGVTTAANYTVSGTGKGTLASNPNTAALVSGNTYVLTWAAGEMFIGGTITITVANAQDVAGNTIGAPNSGTHNGGAIGTAPTVSSVAVQTGLTVNIIFSESMGTGVTTASNYTVSGTGKGTLANNPNTVALVAGNTYILTWAAGEMYNGGNITITVANAQDLAGNVIGAPNSGTHNGGAIGVAPTVSSVAVQTGLTVNIVFSESMGTGVTTASNYTVSGTGKGTLANNPNSVALVAGNTYVLTWSSGEMFNGGNITITVANVPDLAGNPIGAPNSGTHTGGAIGTAPTVSSVAVQTGLTVNIVFSESMGTGVTTAANYTVSGTGKGTLANNPNSVVLVAGSTYRLTWTTGEMYNGGNITITVANVQDLAANVIGAPNSGTHNGGAIGTAPTVSITAPTTGNKVNTAKLITFTDNETTNPQCSVDNANWTACTSGVTTLGTIPEFAGLVEGNTFTLYLKDTDAAGNIGTNNVINITKDTTAPTAGNAGTITTANILPTTLTLNWTIATDNVTLQANLTYRVYQSSNNDIDTVGNIEANGTPLNSYTADISTFGVINLNASTLYFFNIIAKDEAGNKVAYVMKSETTAAVTVPGAPTGLAPTAKDGEVDLVWIAPIDNGGSPITNYKIFRDTASPATTLHDTIGNLLAYADTTNVVNGTQYFYRVVAVNALGDSNFSNEVNATPSTPPPPPSTPPSPPPAEEEQPSGAEEIPSAPTYTPYPSPIPAPAPVEIPAESPILSFLKIIVNFIAQNSQLAYDALISAYQTTSGWVANLLDQSANAIGSASETIAESAENLGAQLSSNYYSFSDTAVDIAAQLSVRLSNGFNSVTATLASSANYVTSRLRSGYQIATDNLAQFSNTLAEQTFPSVAQFTRTTEDKIGENAQYYAGKISQLATSGWQTISVAFNHNLDDSKHFLARIMLGVEKFSEIVFDREPNHISNVGQSISAEEVTITWDTNHLSTSQVNYGSAVGVYEQTIFVKDQTRSHSVILKDLKPGTTYYYELISKNGDYAVDAFRSFTTPK